MAKKKHAAPRREDVYGGSETGSPPPLFSIEPLSARRAATLACRPEVRYIPLW